MHIGHLIEEKQQPISIFFKTNLFKERMKKFVALLMKEKRPGMNGKMMTANFFELYSVHIKKLGQFFFHTLLPIHSSVASYKCFKKLISDI